MTVRELITDSYREIGVFGAADTPDADSMVLGRSTLNTVLDDMNADRLSVYVERFVDYTLTANLSPHTIGPSGTFNVTQRPVSVEAVSIDLGDSVFTPVTVRDAAWYQAQPVPAITTTFPTDVYYAPEWPLGKLYFWGIPTVAYDVRIWTRVVLGELDFDDEFSMPPGARQAVKLTLAEYLAPANGAVLSPTTVKHASQARARMQANNIVVPRVMTQDAGMPQGGGGRATFNYRTGLGR